MVVLSSITYQLRKWPPLVDFDASQWTGKMDQFDQFLLGMFTENKFPRVPLNLQFFTRNIPIAIMNCNCVLFYQTQLNFIHSFQGYFRCTGVQMEQSEEYW